MFFFVVFLNDDAIEEPFWVPAKGWKIKKGNCKFFSQFWGKTPTLFLFTATSHNSDFLSCNFKFISHNSNFSSQNYKFISCNSEINLKIMTFIFWNLRNVREKVWIVNYKLRIEKKKSELQDKNHNYHFYCYPVAETPCLSVNTS